MNRYDAPDPAVSAWFDAEALAPVPVERRDRTLAAIAAQRPRPAILARIGSHWVAEPSPVSEWLDRRGVAMPAVASTSTIVLLLVTLALLGAAIIVGGRLLQATPGDGRLLYERNGDLYLADADGGNPVKVGPGNLAGDGDWAPDGRHFMYNTIGEYPISDADGRTVGAYVHGPGMAGPTVWSPDSTRLARLTHDLTQVSVHGLDGSLQSELRPPDGYVKSSGTPSLEWTPGARSIWVQLCPIDGPAAAAAGDDRSSCPVPERWELPIDASAPRRVAGDLASLEVDELAFSPDGTRLAFVGREGGTDDDYVLYVADADGTDRMPVIRADDGPSLYVQHLRWSPTSDAIAYVNQAQGGSEVGLGVKVVDIATGTARTMFPVLEGMEWPVFSWSPDGARLLLSVQGGPGPDGLWSIAVDGSEPTLLVQGARAGEWQPNPFGR